METERYLDRILAKYAPSFDIKVNPVFSGRTYSAYGCFSSFGEKYVLTRKAKLWAVRAYEYVIFQKTEKASGELLDQMFETLTGHIESAFVRKGEKYPEKDHMYSYLTAVVISHQTPDDETLRHIRELRFDKSYLFSFRGHSEFHLVLADLEGEKIYTNSAGKKMKKVYQKAFEEIRHGAKGYNELYQTGETVVLPDQDDVILPV